MRQLESLIRLSEAMARLHADSVIRPSYVREVCRLLRVSNINLVRSDIEFADNQEEMNREAQTRRQQQTLANTDRNNDLFRMEAEQKAAQAEESKAAAQQPEKKVKITFDEF